MRHHLMHIQWEKQRTDIPDICQPEFGPGVCPSNEFIMA